MEVCLTQHIDIKITSVPNGKDPCDFLLAAGKESFDAMIENAADVFEYKWARLKQLFSTDDTVAGRKNAIDEFLQTIATAMRTGAISAVEKGLIVNKLSRVIGMDSKEINVELSRRVSRAGQATAVENQRVRSVNFGQGLEANAQREVIEVLLNEPGLFEVVRGKVTPGDFDAGEMKTLVAGLFETLTEKPDASLAEILGATESLEMSAWLVELARAGEEKGNFRTRLDGALEVIERHRVLRQRPEVKTAEDLRCICENAGKRNPHSMGMT